jgi:uncharacterized protein YdhG (YjbR/CyaY superfamily)
MKNPENIDAYIASFPPDIQTLLQQMRSMVKQVAPQAEETISYGMPAFKLNGILVWFAAHSNHIGLYPRGSGIEEFAAQLKGYKVSKGTIQFPLNKPLPVLLIGKIVQFRVDENLRKWRKIG